MTILGRTRQGVTAVAVRRMLAAAGMAAVVSGLAACPAWAVPGRAGQEREGPAGQDEGAPLL